MGGTTPENGPATPDTPHAQPGQPESDDARAEHERDREKGSLRDQLNKTPEGARARAEQLLGADLTKPDVDRLLSAEEKEEGLLAYSFSSGIARETKTAAERSKDWKESVALKEDFKEGDTITVDFKSNNQAEWNIGAGDMMPPTVRAITVTDLHGNVRTSTHRIGLKGGFFDGQGYIPVFSGYKIAVVKILSEEERTALRKPNGTWDKKKYESLHGQEDDAFAKKVYQETFHEEWRGARIDSETLERMQQKSAVKEGEKLSDILTRKPNYKEAAENAMRVYGVPMDTIFAFVKYESGFNEYAAARTSSARGLGQFLNDTWDSFIKDIRKEGHKDHALYEKIMADPEWSTKSPRDWRFNPEMSIHAVAWYAEQNARSIGVERTDPDYTFKLYMAHHEGAGGYKAWQKYVGLKQTHPDWSVRKLAAEAHLAGFQKDRIAAGNDPFAAVEAYARRVSNTAGAYRTDLG